VKPNAYSGGKPNFIPGCSGRHRSVATLASRLCKKCSASSRETIRSEAQAACRKRGKGYRGKDGTACPRLSTQCPRSAKALRTSPITSALPTTHSEWVNTTPLTVSHPWALLIIVRQVAIPDPLGAATACSLLRRGPGACLGGLTLVSFLLCRQAGCIAKPEPSSSRVWQFQVKFRGP